MPFDRVIQDSDDEGDPLGELSPESSRVSGTNYEDPTVELQEGNHDSHIRVNFDHFLQSQDASHAMLSSSQQRREDRWIPATGRIRSMGTMMNEIGLAQQRLFDDDHQAQYANQQTAFDELELPPTLEQEANYEIFAQEEGAHLAVEHPIEPTHNSFPRPEFHVAAPSDDWSQSAPSYNIFDSSCQTPSGQLNRADFIRDSGITTQNEPMQNLEVRRWTSMQEAASSPHDTEPFSSVISPQVARTKSDNMPSAMMQPVPVSIEELALPAVTEMPKVEKRGRKKKQTQPLNGEDDELAFVPPREPPTKKIEKRKPGRPPKNIKISLDESVNTGTGVSSAPGHPTCEIQDELTAQQPPHIELPDDHPQVVAEESLCDAQNMLLNTTEEPQLPPAPTEKPKKKKLKRGKTTSVTITKSIESDIEDDVIWIDERPALPETAKKQAAPKPAASNGNAASEPTPAPKKRGRKRKKTAEELDQEVAAAAADQQDAQAKTTTEVTNNTLQPNNDVRNGPGVSVVLNNTSRTRTLDTTTTTTTSATANPISNHNPPQEEPKEETRTPQPPETPQKPTGPQTPSIKGPGKHSPISTCKVPYRVGLSKRARIAPLLKIIKR
ncbi:hypothetical protein BJX99DRAFT_222342 [Aspergillus californicus]